MAKQEHPKEGVLIGAAKKIGTITGKIASLAGGAAPGGEARPQDHADRPGKLPKKHKSRLPRREKKARQKALAAGQPSPE